ncbi:hypothetical protein H5123_09205 [Shewanella sp. SR43-4]|jgi:hypothetical protein|uniref:hypothetical protein n=1 Tax=Shewanella sp. SR43-4 TaxID=2760942 RepID=UPI0015FB110B|nr:hypothetical protein [Shewanella sp. SR43-4]MBB1317818.1 hypothetical protein [Shewanella sp. SR43-4]
MEIRNLEKALIFATDGIKVIPPRSLLVESGLQDSEARAFYQHLKNKGYVKLSALRAKLLEEAGIEFEAMKLSISINLEDAISTST